MIQGFFLTAPEASIKQGIIVRLHTTPVPAVHWQRTGRALGDQREVWMGQVHAGLSVQPTI